MQVLDQQIGRFFIKGSGALTEEDKSLIGAIAKQVGQQVESIRLLADASRARAEAEEATRRLTRQLRTAGAQLAVAERSVESAAESRRVAGDRYREGVIPSSELLDAEARIVQALPPRAALY